MTQQSVYDLLKKKKKWMTSHQIAKILKISSGSVSTCLNKLFKQGDVLRKPPHQIPTMFGRYGHNPYLWSIK